MRRAIQKSIDLMTGVKEPYESPIEKLLGEALARIDGLKVQPQAQIGHARVDFLVEARFNHERPVFAVIECDGEAFHHDKRADMDRQAKLLALGLSVIRFTGSEINSDVDRCVENVLHLLRNKSWGL